MDLTTQYLGLTLRSPLIVGAAAPLTEDIDNIKRMEDAGAGAVVLHSLFEEQIRKEKLELHHHFTYGTDSFAEALNYFPENASDVFHVGVETYLEGVYKVKIKRTGFLPVKSLRSSISVTTQENSTNVSSFLPQ